MIYFQQAGHDWFSNRALPLYARCKPDLGWEWGPLHNLWWKTRRRPSNTVSGSRLHAIQYLQEIPTSLVNPTISSSSFSSYGVRQDSSKCTPICTRKVDAQTNPADCKLSEYLDSLRSQNKPCPQPHPSHPSSAWTFRTLHIPAKMECPSHWFRSMGQNPKLTSSSQFWIITKISRQKFDSSFQYFVGDMKRITIHDHSTPNA